MFHVKHRMYTQITMTIPQAGQSIHAAELEEIDHNSCSMLRIVELDPEGVVKGAASHNTVVGMFQRPNDVVPHPRTYNSYEDIDALELSPEEFEALWAEAKALFPSLR